MVEIKAQDAKLPILFNSPMETGVRSLIVLEAAHPQSFDLTTLTWLDHLVVHTGDFDGPESLHPATPQRSGEVLVRRQLVENGLTLLRRLHLANAIVDRSGIRYQASDEAYPVVGLMRSAYLVALKERANWLASQVIPRGEGCVEQLIREKQGRWNNEFQNVTSQVRR